MACSSLVSALFLNVTHPKKPEFAKKPESTNLNNSYTRQILDLRTKPQVSNGYRSINRPIISFCNELMCLQRSDGKKPNNVII